MHSFSHQGKSGNQADLVCKRVSLQNSGCSTDRPGTEHVAAQGSPLAEGGLLGLSHCSCVCSGDPAHPPSEWTLLWPSRGSRESPPQGRALDG